MTARKPKPRKPHDINGYYLTADVNPFHRMLFVRMAAGPVNLMNAKILHAWLGRAIAYLESKERGEK